MSGPILLALWVLAGLASLVRYLIRTGSPTPPPKQRITSRGWGRLAAQQRWSYQPGPDADLGHSFRYLESSPEGFTRWTAYDIVSGDHRGHPCLALNLSYLPVNDQSSSQIRHVSIAALQISTDRALPDLRIRPENRRTRVANLVTNDDIDFDSIEFSRAFEVSSSDRRFASDFCSPTMMEYLLARPDRHQLRLEVDGPWLQSVHQGPGEPSSVRARLDRLTDVLDHIPPHLLDG